MTEYFIGFDVGGTKTHALIVNEQGEACGFGKAGSGNHEVVGYDGFLIAVDEACNQALAQSKISKDQISGAGFGVGGYDWPSQYQDHMDAIHKLGLNAPVELVNDAIIGLVAGAKNGWGIAVVSGTGCNCWGWDDKRNMAHLTGGGDRMGEACGANELIVEAIRSISRAWSCRGPETKLTEAFMRVTGAKSSEDLLEGLVMNHYHVNADSARLVFQTAAEGDLVAQNLVKWAGESLADLALGVIRKLKIEDRRFEVILAGNLYNAGEAMIGPMRSKIQIVAPGAIMVRLRVPPVIGAVLLGMQGAGRDGFRVRGNLIRTTKTFLAEESAEIAAQ